MRLAEAIYNDQKVSRPSEDAGPSFEFLKANEVVAEHPKFEMAFKSFPSNPKPEPMTSINE